MTAMNGNKSKAVESGVYERYAAVDAWQLAILFPTKPCQ